MNKPRMLTIGRTHNLKDGRVSGSGCAEKRPQTPVKRDARWALLGAWKAAQALLGVGLAPDDVIAERKAICAACEFVKAGGGCQLCGCTSLKITLADMFCVHNPPKWNAHKVELTQGATDGKSTTDP